MSDTLFAPPVRWTHVTRLMPSGKRVSVQALLNNPDLIDIGDIAHVLSMTCRFQGRCKYFYSNADHSIRVAEEVRKTGGTHEEILAGLLHDAAEYVLDDIYNPLKQTGLFAPYRQWEDHLLRKIGRKYRVEGGAFYGEKVRTADRRLLATELRDLVWYVNQSDYLEETAHMPPPLPEEILPRGPQEAKYDFLRLFHSLTPSSLTS